MVRIAFIAWLFVTHAVFADAPKIIVPADTPSIIFRMEFSRSEIYAGE